MKNTEKLVQVSPVQDDSCHWYIIPKELTEQFYDDLNDEDLIDSGEFDDKYGKYRTGGALNCIDFFVREKDLNNL